MVKIMKFDEELEIPEDVKVEIKGENQITIEGPNGGPITKDFSHARGIKLEIQDNKMRFSSHFPRKSNLA